jgi:1-phosphofructokinase
MIYTVTCNPCLDYVVKVPDFSFGKVNRTDSEEILPGGKGLNVSLVLNNLGMDTVALGFIAGFTGKEIQQRVERMGCRTEFIELSDGFSRINIKLKAKEESEINGQGPDIPEGAMERLYERLDRLESGDILVLAGSIPNTLPADLYEKMMERLQGTGVEVVVDATRDLLKNVLKYRPFLIKPNHHELQELFGEELDTIEQIKARAKMLQELGAKNVLVSMAAKGAVLASEAGDMLVSKPPEGKVVNSVGAGDSMVAGFLAGYLKDHNYETAFRMGLATGSASAFSEGLATKQEVEALLQTMK